MNTNNHPFQTFIALVNFDQQIHDLIIKKNSIAQDIIAIGQQLQHDEEQLVHNKKIILEAKKAVDMIELDMKTLDQKEKRTKKKLEQVLNYKESEALYREIEQLAAKQYLLEESLLQAWHGLEKIERSDSEYQKMYRQRKTDSLVLLEQKKNAQGVIQAAIEQHEHEREQRQVGIPEEWLRKYDMMRLQVDNPVVAVESDSCGACFHELSKQELMKLRHGALLECKICFRFLYDKNVMGNA